MAASAELQTIRFVVVTFQLSAKASIYPVPLKHLQLLTLAHGITSQLIDHLNVNLRQTSDVYFFTRQPNIH